MRCFPRQVTLLLLILPLSQASASSIQIAPVRMEVVTERDVPAACGTSRANGCTLFRGERLDCSCVRHEDGWRIHAVAQFIPYMYLTRLDISTHEMLHVNDIRATLTAYLQHLESDRYESADECARTGEIAARDFGQSMDRWKKESNKKRHGYERARP